MIDQIKFRKLDNGYTVKIHVCMIAPGAEQPPKDGPRTGYSVSETYVRDVKDLKEYISQMIDKHGMEFEIEKETVQ